MENRQMLACPACGDSGWVLKYKIDHWNIEECRRCSFARIDSLPVRESRPEYYSKEKVVERNVKKKTALQKFSRTMKQLFSKATNRNKNDIFYNKLRSYLSPGQKVLDVGCGDGSFLKLAKHSFSCTGVEISDYLCDLARKGDGIKVINGDFLSVSLAGEKFDGITLISLLEHLDDPMQVISKCYNLLNYGGVLLIKTVNYGCLNRVLKKNKWTGFRPPDHLVYFSPRNLKLLLKRLRFSKIRISSWPFNDNMYCDVWK